MKFEQTTTTAAGADVEYKETPWVVHSIYDFVIQPASRNALYSALYGVGLGFVVLAVGYQILWMVIPGFGLVFMGGGGVLMLHERLSQYVILTEKTTKKKPIPQSVPIKGPSSVVLDLGPEWGQVRIMEPKQGSFRQWARLVANDKTGKIHFSQNGAKDREWTSELYWTMISQLQSVGMVHNSELFNSTPKVTNEGRKRLREWVNHG